MTDAMQLLLNPHKRPSRFEDDAAWKKWIDDELKKPPVTKLVRKPGGEQETIEIGYVLVRLNEIYGESWSFTSRLTGHEVRLIESETDRGRRTSAWSAWAAAEGCLTLSLPWGTVVRSGVGTCDNENCGGPGSAIDMAWKGAESDALKRAALTLGDTFGLQLRIKDELRGKLDARGDDASEIERERERRHEADYRDSRRGERDRDDDRRDRDDDRRDRGRDRERGRDDRRRDERDDRRTPERSRRELEEERGPAFDRDRRDEGSRGKHEAEDRNANDDRNDPSFEELYDAGWERRMAQTLATLPSDRPCPKDTLKDLWDMGLSLIEADLGGAADPVDTLMAWLADLGIDDRNVSGRDARRIALTIMTQTKGAKK